MDFFSEKQDNKINSSFIYKGPRSSVKGCRIQFSVHSVCRKLSCFPGPVSVPAGWGCPLGGAPAATAASP